MTKFPKISVIVPAYNEETKIEKCLKALLNQEYEPIEIILINNGSTDRTGEIAENLSKENKKIKVFGIKENIGGPAPAKNLGSRKSKGEILVFVDADEYVRKDYLEKLTKPIREKKAKTAIGSWYVAQPKNPWTRCRFKDSHKLRRHALQSGVFRAIDKKLFLKIGGYNEKKGYSDDRLKTGVERARVEDAIFDHDIDTSLKKMFIRNKWIGSTSFSNPKNNQFKIKIILLLMAALGLIASFFISGWFLLIIPLFFLFFFYKTLKKIIFYGDVRLIIYYPVYLFTYALAILIGFSKGFSRSIFKSS